MANAFNDTNRVQSTGSAYNSLTAFFNSRFDAESAVRRLKEAGIADGNIRLVSGDESDTQHAASNDRGFWAKLEDFFFPDEDRAVYSEGLRRGGFLVSVSQLSDALYTQAHDILDDEGSIDLDERADQWRSEGWKAETNAGTTSPKLDLSPEAYRQTNLSAGRDETIDVVEETLKVGKRDVNSGSVKVRAYTVETPVREDLTLRDENVSIERKAVDRPLTDADRAFEDRTIRAEEHHEEAVVSKEARVVEEIGIRKTASERSETINDTVRKTEVEVDDERNQSPRAGGFSDTKVPPRTI